MNVEVMTTTDEDQRLIDAARAGRRSAFDELVRRHARPAARLAGRLVGNREDAEDVVQEAFARAFQHLDGFRGGSSFRTWLLRITVHQSQDLLRRRSRSRVTTRDPALGEPLSNEPGPARRTESRDSVKRLTDALDELPPRQKAALFLKVYEGMSYDEVAAALGTTVAAARVYLWLARQSIRRRFEHRLGPEVDR